MILPNVFGDGGHMVARIHSERFLRAQAASRVNPLSSYDRKIAMAESEKRYRYRTMGGSLVIFWDFWPMGRGSVAK